MFNYVDTAHSLRKSCELLREFLQSEDETRRFQDYMYQRVTGESTYK